MATAATDGEVFVGIDVAQDELVAAIRPGDGVTRWPNDEAGHEGLARHLRDRHPALVVLEATGGLEQAASAALAEAGLPVVIANPKQVRIIAHAKIKTDTIDAGVLAQLYASGFLPEVWIPDEPTQALRRQVTPAISSCGNAHD